MKTYFVHVGSRPIVSQRTHVNEGDWTNYVTVVKKVGFIQAESTEEAAVLAVGGKVQKCRGDRAYTANEDDAWEVYEYGEHNLFTVEDSDPVLFVEVREIDDAYRGRYIVRTGSSAFSNREMGFGAENVYTTIVVGRSFLGPARRVSNLHNLIEAHFEGADIQLEAKVYVNNYGNDVIEVYKVPK